MKRKEKTKEVAVGSTRTAVHDRGEVLENGTPIMVVEVSTFDGQRW